MSTETKQTSQLTSDWKTYKRLFGYIKPYSGWLLLGVIGYILFASANALYTDILKQLIDYISQDTSSKSLISPPNFLNLDIKTFVVTAAIGVSIMRGIGAFCGMFGINRVAHSVVFALRNKLHTHYLDMLAKDYDKQSTGALTAKISFTIDQVAGSVSDGLLVIVRELLTTIALLSIMIYYSWKLTFLFLAVLPIIVIVLALAAKYFRKIQQRIQFGMENITYLISEVVTGQAIVKAFQAKSFEKQRFETANKRFFKHNITNVLVNSISVPTIQIMIATINAAVIWIAMDDIFIGTMSAGSFVAFFVAAGLLAPSIRKLSNVNYIIQKGLVAARDIFDILDQEKEQDSKGKISLWKTDGGISFQNVNFAYSTKKQTLTDINFNIAPKSTVAVIGKSGGGKSTLIKILLRLYSCSSGKVLIDGFPLEDLTLASVRSHISLVSQSNILFNDSVVCNVAYGQDLSKVNEEDIKKALKDANALDFVEALPQGIYTVVGEKGSLLSGGQAQRIAIARALYKKAAILILDEATSALDSESEKAIQDAIEKTKHHATRFIITHRMATIQQADWLLVLDGGKLVQQGIEKDLRQQEGIYRSLLQGQFLLNSDDANNVPVKKPETKKIITKYSTKKKVVKARSWWRKVINNDIAGLFKS